ncbi:response regulator transcription factor [Arthrobacter sp. D1-17]
MRRSGKGRASRNAGRLTERGAQHHRLQMGKGWLHLAMDRVEEARAELAGAVPTEFAHGSQRISLWAQAWLARADFALGSWDDALRTVQPALAMQEESGIELLRPLLHWTGAQIQALRGNWHAAADHLELGAASHDLTEQEKAVAALVASGLSNKEAAAELYVSVKTVQYHLTRIYAKLGVTSRSGLAAIYPGR